MQPLTPELPKTRFTTQPADIVVGQGSYRFVATDKGGEVRETSLSGARAYPVEHVMGGKNVYYLLTPLERGRLQVLPIAYDVRRGKWFDTSASGMRHFENTPETPVDWRDPLYTFNTSCYGCHVSQLSTNYDLETDTYRTTWSEPGINCETCHGPSSEHIRVCREAAPGQRPQDLKIIITSKFTPEQHNASCSSCHAKASVLTRSYRPGEPFFNYFDLVTLENPDYYPDGRDLGENYTYTGWRMNRCAAASSLHCVRCHTSSGRNRFAGDKANDACLPCHEARVRNAAAHTHHKPDGEGNKCISCHMPKTEFANMVRSDHSFRPPMPRATIEFRSPNACNICHKDRDAAWSDRQVRRWYGDDYQNKALRPARLVAAARNRDWSRLPDMLAYIADPRHGEIYATSLIRLLSLSRDGRLWPVLEAAMRDRSPLVRAAAAGALGGHLTASTVNVLAAATRDEVRLVRLRAAGALAEYPLGSLEPGERHAVEKALAELEGAYKSRPDDWASQFNLGNYCQSRGDLKGALKAYRFSSRLRADIVQPLVNAAIVYSRLGDQQAAEEALGRALRIEPSNAAANFNMGLLKAETGEVVRAEEHLRAALKEDPAMAAAAYNLGVLISQNRPAEAIEWCRKARDLDPQEPKYAYTLAFFLIERGASAEALSLLRGLVSTHPDYYDAYGLLASACERRGDLMEAREVLKRALSRTGMPDRERQLFAARIQAIR
jgi:tetratricopeptide (TPR) repeat protein